MADQQQEPKKVTLETKPKNTVHGTEHMLITNTETLNNYIKLRHAFRVARTSGERHIKAINATADILDISTDHAEAILGGGYLVELDIKASTIKYYVPTIKK